MSLFQKSVKKKYLNELDSALVDKKFNDFQSCFGNTEIQENIRNSKEEEFQEGFIRELFVNIFNYTLKPKPEYNIVLEKKNVDDTKKADGAILKNDHVIAVIELKSTSTADLDTVETQAFGYKNHHPACVYVITSNFEKLRFYIQNAVDYLEFDLFNLSKKQFFLLWLCLSKDNILNDLPLTIKKSSVLQEEDVTKKLYADYSKFREAIFENIAKNNPDKDELLLYNKTQKLLDRFLFIFFAEDRLLLPPNSISEIVKQWTTLKEELDTYIPLYDRFKKYFGYMNTGYKGKKYDIFPYNGGLFLPDEILDNITIDDNILHEHTVKLSAYDFETDVDVNILGHIFEHSLAEIENVQAKLRGEQIDKQNTKRKKEGIYYTPKYITKYIVENTVGKLCEEKRNELEIIDEEYVKGRKNRKKDTIKALDKKLTTYKKWLLSLTILDPACGSGAFLNQALDFLINEHKKVDELRAQLLGGEIIFSDITTEILENNIYGVDLNEESVEIAKLSLWLRTAQKGRKLNTLSNNIKCGNSLIDDPEVAGEKAFDWQKEFPEIFAKGGFDVVIGNPPYAKYNAISPKEKKYLINSNIYGKTGDLSEFFIKKALTSFLNKNAKFSFIVPKGLTYVKSWKGIRNNFLNNVSLVGLYDVSKAFKDALYEMIIFNVINTEPKNSTLKCGYFDEQNKIDNIFFLGFPKSYIPIIKKIKTTCVPVSNFMDYWYGKGGMTPLVNTQGKGMQVLTGKEIGKYYFNKPKEKWFLEIKKLSDIDKHRAKVNKVVVQDIVAHILNPKPHIKLTASIDRDEQFCLNTVMCFSENSNGFKNEFLLSIINSKFISFYYYYFIFNQAIRTMHFMPGYADLLPIPNNAIKSQDPFIERTNKMLELNERLQEKSNKFLNRTTDNFEIEMISKKLDAFYEYDFRTFVD